MDLDLAKERGLLLVQGPAGPAIVEDENEDWSLVGVRYLTQERGKYY
jgi:hypothetical protein